MSTDDELLARHRPVLQFDSQESYFADGAAILTDRPGNALKRAEGGVLAGKGAAAPLDITVLAGTAYATGDRARKTDFVDAIGRDYVAQARAMHHAPYADRIHGHAVRDAMGSLWLQYWFFHYYNDKAFLGVGLHEGDWEMIQLRLGADQQPREVTYAQHNGGERRAWSGVEQAASPDGPVAVVYSARGSHASYFARGSHSEAPVVPDHNDGRGRRVRPAVIVISDGAPAWASWRGVWGSTRARAAWESASPGGPREHRQWTDPLAFHKAARPQAPRVVAPGTGGAPPAPLVTARREQGHVLVDWTVRPDAEGRLPDRLVLSVDGTADDLPPATEMHRISGSHGTVEHGLRLDPAAGYELRASAVSADGLTSATRDVPVPRV